MLMKTLDYTTLMNDAFDKSADSVAYDAASNWLIVLSTMHQLDLTYVVQ